MKPLVRAAVPRPLYRLIRRRRVLRLIEGYEPRIAAHTYAGYPLRVKIADPLAAGWYDHDWPRLPEVELLRKGRLGLGARVFDLGAHQCVVAMIVARIVGDAGTVVAVEAEPHNVRVGEANRELNGLNNLTIVHAAASDRGGSLLFAEGLNGRVEEGASWGKVSVSAITVDALAGAHGAPDVVMMDIEGFEGRALRGARDTLALGDADFFVEVHTGIGLEDADGSVAELLAAFPPDRYERFVAPASSELDDYRFRPLVEAGDTTASRFFLVALARRHQVLRSRSGSAPA